MNFEEKNKQNETTKSEIKQEKHIKANKSHLMCEFMKNHNHPISSLSPE